MRVETALEECRLPKLEPKSDVLLAMRPCPPETRCAPLTEEQEIALFNRLSYLEGRARKDRAICGVEGE